MIIIKQCVDAIKRYIKSADIFLLVLALVISAFGLLLIYSSALRLAGGPNRYIIVQSIGAVLGVIGFVILSIIDLDRFPRIWIVLLALNVLFQLSLQFLGVADNTGNKSWIRFGGIGVQPGEVGKVIFIFTLASHMRLLRGKINAPLSMLQLIAHLGITCGSVFIVSRDLGVALMYPLIFFGMLIVSGVSPWWIGGMIGGGVAAMPILWQFISEGQKLRIMVVFEPSLNPDKAWQAQKGQLAISNGQLIGQGFAQGELVQNGWVPKNHTDFIFATCGEELGFIGCTILLLLLTALVFRIFYDAYICRSYMGMLVGAGVGSMFMFQIMINVGMCMGVMPVIGLTLPFVSYGGTSMVTTIAALGLVCGYIRRQRPRWLDAN